MNVRVIYNSSIPPMLANADGITLYPFVLIAFPETDPRTPKLLKHEMVHVEQVRRLGFLKFYILYVLYSIRYGYRNNPFEVEAYERQEEP